MEEVRQANGEEEEEYFFSSLLHLHFHVLVLLHYNGSLCFLTLLIYETVIPHVIVISFDITSLFICYIVHINELLLRYA